MLDLSKLTAINPVDGRYEDQTKNFGDLCEFGNDFGEGRVTDQEAIRL